MSRGVGTMAAGRRRRSLRLLGAWGVFSHLLEGSRSAPHHWEMRGAATAALLPLFCSARLAQKSDCQLLGDSEHRAAPLDCQRKEAVGQTAKS